MLVNRLLLERSRSFRPLRKEGLTAGSYAVEGGETTSPAVLEGNVPERDLVPISATNTDVTAVVPINFKLARLRIDTNAVWYDETRPAG